MTPKSSATNHQSVRILAGRLKGLKLVNLNPQTHPMGTRERNALFNLLGRRVHGARVLDLCAGTGALGIEALSRGASSALLVDREDANIRQNCAHIRKLAPACACRPLKASVHTFLAQIAQTSTAPNTFDLIFADPPYAEFARFAPEMQRLGELLAQTGALVISQPKTAATLAIAPLTPVAVKTYAGAKIVVYERTD